MGHLMAEILLRLSNENHKRINKKNSTRFTVFSQFHLTFSNQANNQK